MRIHACAGETVVNEDNSKALLLYSATYWTSHIAKSVHRLIFKCGISARILSVTM